MKILHINSYYNGSKFYKNLYDEQIKSGLDIDVFVPVSHDFNNKKVDFGDYTKISKNHGKLDRFIFHLKHYKILKDVQEKYNIKKYSIIHAHSLFSNGYIAMKLNEKYGTPYIVAVRSTDVNIFFDKLKYLKNTGIKILSNSKSIIFLSDTYKDFVTNKYIPDEIKDKISSKSIIIPNGISDFWFYNKNNSRKLSEDIINLLFVGIICKRKNLKAVIEASKILIEKGYKINLNVVGKIEDENIYNEVKDMPFLKFHGFKTKEELLKIYRKNDIFVLPSIHETFGLVYGEAMSQGLPVMYTKGQGFDGQFKDGEIGYSVDCFNEEDIAKKILMIKDRYEELSENAVKKVDKFRWETITRKYKNLYN